MPPRTRSSPGEPTTRSHSSPPYSSSYAVGVPGDAAGIPAWPSSLTIVSQRVAGCGPQPTALWSKTSGEPVVAVTAAGTDASVRHGTDASVTAATIEAETAMPFSATSTSWEPPPSRTS